MERSECGCPEGADGNPIHIPGCRARNKDKNMTTTGGGDS